MYRSQFMTHYGAGIVYATDLGVVKVDIPDMSCHELILPKKLPGFESSELTAYCAHKLQSYFNGEIIDFCDIPVDIDSLPPFRQKVLLAIRSLGYGEISTYGQVAKECGSPAAARATGGALAANPVPVIIPCHRVIASDGSLTGFSAPGGEGTKMALLKMEGAEFKGLLVDKKRVVINRVSCR